jgi:hypothetical protein
MPYRPYEYVPEPYRQDDNRLNALMMQQANQEALRLRQQGQNTAATWAGIGNTVQGVLGDLAKYRREAPARAEAERVRREASNKRGLDMMAGESGMDETARGELYRKSGYGAEGQDIIAKDTRYKADKASLDWTQKQREAETLSEATNKFFEIEKSANPAAAYELARPELEKMVGKERAAKLPPTYNKEQVDVFRSNITTIADRIKQNALAQSDSSRLKDENATITAQVESARSMMTRLLAIADEEGEAVSAWRNFDASVARLPEARRKEIEEQIGLSRTFSIKQQQHAAQLLQGPAKAPNDVFSMAVQGFFDEKGYYPRTDAEIESVKRRAYTAPQISPADRARIENEAHKEYNDAEQWARTNLGSGTPEFNQYMVGVLDRYEAALGGGGGGSAAGGGSARGGGSLANLDPQHAGAGAPAAGGASTAPGGRPVVVQTPKGPRVFPSQAAADGYMQSLQGGKGSAPAAPGGPDYSDQLYGADQSAPSAPPDYSDQLYGASGAAAPTAAAAPRPRPRAGAGWMAGAAPMPPAPPSYTGPVPMPSGEETGRAMLGGAAPRPQPPPRPIATQSVAPQGPAGTYPVEARSLADARRPVAPPSAPSDLTPEQIVAQTKVTLPEAAPVSQRLEVLQGIMNAAGYDIRPISTTRTAAEQAELHRQGRTPRTGAPGDESQHQAGTAADYALFINGKRVSRDHDPKVWELLGLAAQKVGLEWGGNYNDPNHVELPPQR